MPMTVWPSDAMNSFGAYVAAAATVSVPCDLMDAGTWAAIELTALEGVGDDAEPEPALLPHAAANRPTVSKVTVTADSFIRFLRILTGTPRAGTSRAPSTAESDHRPVP